VYMRTGSIMKVYQVLGHVSVTVIQFLITPANVASRKIDCHSARLSGFIRLQDRKLLLAAERHGTAAGPYVKILAVTALPTPS